MDPLRVSLFIFSICTFNIALIYSQKFKFCVVDGRGGFNRSTRFCPILDQSESQVECVLGVDRLDCLRFINKGLADFSVFTPEDLVIATNSEIEILVTNELRYTEDDFEYEVVAVINDASGITSKHDLKDKRFCHPGYGYEIGWTRILSNYLEASVVPQTCDPNLTLTENRIKASSKFFQSACKAGPWVNNATLDLQLKEKYSNLCESCGGSRCLTNDKYWGRRGSLLCLTDGAGDISWARLNDVKVHFGLVPGGAESTPDGYSYLCPDGSIKPLINTTNPCTWVVKPWPVIATKRTSAQRIQELLANLPDEKMKKLPWQQAFIQLIEIYHLSIEKLEPIVAIETYLSKANGFLNANSFSGCHPPRTIKICTTSILENYKCSWLRESAAVYGIEPDLDCIKADNTTHCMQAVNQAVADIVMVSPDLFHLAKKHHLQPLFYETANDQDKYLTVAVSLDKVSSLNELKGRKACFPKYDGIAWNSIMDALHKKGLIKCPADMFTFFDLKANRTNLGEFGAIRCLLSDSKNVAFISRNSIEQYFRSPRYQGDNHKGNLSILCDQSVKDGCHFSWAPLAYGMVRSNSSNLWLEDTLDVFLHIDTLFGKKYKTVTAPFQLFGVFNRKSNVLFHDNTVGFRDVPIAKVTDKMTRNYENIISKEFTCTTSGSCKTTLSLLLLIFICFLFVIRL